MTIDKTLMLRAIGTYGKDKQWAQVQEELGELGLEIHKYLNRDKSHDQMKHILNELADVNIMIAQANAMVDYDRLQEWIDLKQERLRKRLDEIN